MAAPVVGVVGMAALRRDINRLTDDTESELYAGIKAAGRSVAEPIAGAVRGALPTGTRTDGTLQGDVRVSSTRTGASIRMGRASVPYAGWVEFGGTRPDSSSRDYMPNGRYLFPTARARAGRAGDAYSDALAKVFASDRIWTNTTTDGSQVHD